MYIKNKLGIYLYPDNVTDINNIHWSVNSITHTPVCKYRFIYRNCYGIGLNKTYHNNVQKK